jgi:hypothetical protein
MISSRPPAMCPKPSTNPRSAMNSNLFFCRCVRPKLCLGEMSVSKFEFRSGVLSRSGFASRFRLESGVVSRSVSVVSKMQVVGHLVFDVVFLNIIVLETQSLIVPKTVSETPHVGTQDTSMPCITRPPITHARRPAAPQSAHAGGSVPKAPTRPAIGDAAPGDARATVPLAFASCTLSSAMWRRDRVNVRYGYTAI